MSSVSGVSPFASAPDEINLRILSFLDDRSLQAMACVSKQFNALAQDFQIWRPKTEREFGKVLADGAKQPNKSWKETYNELASSRQARIEGAAEVIQTQLKKVATDDVQYRTARAASALFGFAMPGIGTHYYPTGQTGSLGGRKITVYKLAES